MLIDGIDHIGLALVEELKNKETSHPEYMYYFNYFRFGIEIRKNSLSVVEGHSIRGKQFYHVICYNWNPDFRILRDVYRFEFQNFKNDKWNRKYTIGDFSTLDDAKKCFNLVVKLFVNEQTGDLF